MCRYHLLLQFLNEQVQAGIIEIDQDERDSRIPAVLASDSLGQQ